jgi:CheY-like chemotaxis protein
MRSAAQGALATTRQLLSFSRQGSGPGQPADPARSLRALTRNLQRLMPDHIKVELDVDEGLPPVRMPAGEFEQVVLNLALNARDAMPTGGTVVLRCTTKSDDASGDRLLVEVADQGTGMPADTLSRVFDPFFTTKQDKGGTGLGLSMVHGMVRKAGGEIRIDSTPGAGTRVRVTLPLAALPAPDEDPITGEIRVDERRILVLEDDPAVRRTLCRVLSRAGYEVTGVSDVTGALREIDAHRFDALLTDALLSDGNSSTAITRFIERDGRAIVIHSGHLAGDAVLAGVEAGEYAFEQKPASGDDLVAALERELTRRRPDRAAAG